jgi:hypothetical protein
VLAGAGVMTPSVSVTAGFAAAASDPSGAGAIGAAVTASAVVDGELRPAR